MNTRLFAKIISISIVIACLTNCTQQTKLKPLPEIKNCNYDISDYTSNLTQQKGGYNAAVGWVNKENKYGYNSPFSRNFKQALLKAIRKARINENQDRMIIFEVGAGHMKSGYAYEFHWLVSNGKGIVKTEIPADLAKMLGYSPTYFNRIVLDCTPRETAMAETY